MTGVDELRASAGEAGRHGVLLGTLVAALGALLVLIFVFRSFTALVPLLMALVAIPTTMLLVWPVAAITDVSVIVQFLVALIGLGIAIDYALLVVVRWREERERERVTNEMAVRNTMQHAGAAVVLSGTTVAIAMLALIALPVPVLRSIGIAGLLIPLVTSPWPSRCGRYSCAIGPRSMASQPPRQRPPKPACRLGAPVVPTAGAAPSHDRVLARSSSPPLDPAGNPRADCRPNWAATPASRSCRTRARHRRSPFDALVPGDPKPSGAGPGIGCPRRTAPRTGAAARRRWSQSPDEAATPRPAERRSSGSVPQLFRAR